jgi:hypothetical protein
MKQGKKRRMTRMKKWEAWFGDRVPRRAEWDPDWDWPRLPPVRSGNHNDLFPIDFNFVTDRVATGGGIWTEADVETLRVAGITHVVTAADELHATTARLLEGQMPYLLNGTKDDGVWKGAWWFAKTVEFARDALADPSAKVYLHCWSGKNRGPTSAYAVLRATGYSAAQAERLIREARPKVVLLYRRDAEEALERMGVA